MAITHARGVYFQGRDNNYLIAGNVCNAFAVGELGATDDFFLVGSEPSEESSYPLLTGNILDSEGNVLFRLVRNILIINPGNCSRIMGNQLGYEVHDGAGKLIFRVRTEFAEVGGIAGPTWVMTLSGNFYDKHQKLALAAKSGEQGEYLEANTKHVLGYANGSFGAALGLDLEELEFARVALETHGSIHQAVRGEIAGQTIAMEGKLFKDVTLRNCNLAVDRGDFVVIGKFILDTCRIVFSGPAQNAANLALMVAGQPPLPSGPPKQS